MKNNKKNVKKKKKPGVDPGPIPITNKHAKDMFPTAVNTKPTNKIRVLRIPGR